jgi:hypothetical protein
VSYWHASAYRIPRFPGSQVQSPLMEFIYAPSIVGIGGQLG